MNPQLDIGVKLSGSDQFASDAKVTQDALVKMDAQTKRIIQTQKSLSKQSGNLRGVFGQLGYQVQDVAVQLQMGQNAMMVFGQQGSQVLSIFGGWGAIAGAVVAVGSALYTASQAAKLSRDDMDELSSSLDTIAEKYKKAAGSARDLARIELVGQMDELRKQMQSAQDETDTLNVKIGSLMRRGDEKGAEKLIKEARLLSIQYAASAERLAEFEKVLNTTTKTEQDAIDRTTAQNKALSELITSVVEESQTYGMTNDELIKYKLRKAGANEETVAAVAAIQSETDALEKKAKKEIELKKLVDAGIKKQGELGENPQLKKLNEDFAILMEAKNAQYELERITEQEHRDAMLGIVADYQDKRAALEAQQLAAQEMALMQMDSAILGQIQGMTQQLGSMFDESSGLGKAFYVANQALAAGLAIVNGMLAASAIRTAAAQQAMMFPLAYDAILAKGEIQANMATASGYITAGMIAGQTLASFEGGGLTGSGVRSGGIDGKGGMIAMLHPNEKVTDLTRDGAQQPVQVNFNITSADTRDFDRLISERQGMIVSMITRAVNNSGRRLGA